MRRGESVSPPFRPSGWLRGSTGDAPCAASSCKRTSNATTWSRCTRAARSTTTSLRYRRCISVVTSSRTASSSAGRDAPASAGGARRKRMQARPRCWRDRTGERNVQRMFRGAEGAATLYAVKGTEKTARQYQSLLRTLTSHWKMSLGRLERGWLALLSESEYRAAVKDAAGCAASCARSSAASCATEAAEVQDSTGGAGAPTRAVLADGVPSTPRTKCAPAPAPYLHGRRGDSLQLRSLQLADHHHAG